jgi:serine/threonine protein kinase/Tol biopolymer transport system component
MSLAPGTRVGPYEILSLLGAGGMGEVYRAKDTKLNRDVALKVLPDAFAWDVDRLARFKREAQVLASLNHPHISAIYGFEESNVQALVLELVEGPTLADRIAQGPIPLDEALPIARQTADALEAAHEQGIIHRDLKPANIKLRPDGTVKVLDFGLAKMLDSSPAATSGPTSESPTITSPALAGMTRQGVILGTAAYMAPEQVRGKTVDKRTDVWAFGCVLFEMLTGRIAFPAQTVTDALGAVLERQPDWQALPATLSPAIQKLLQRCLEKDAKRRLHDIADARIELEDESQTRASALEPSRLVRQPPPRSVRRQAAWVAASVLIGVATAMTMQWRPKSSSIAGVTRFAIALPQDQQLALARQAVAISPDGSRIVYAAGDKLFVRTMWELEPRAIPGADRGWHPAFSPDGQSLVFWADGSLKRVPLAGGAPATICESATAPSGITWGNDGILFAQPGTGIIRVSPNGGRPEVLVNVNALEESAHGPEMLPDGATLLFTLNNKSNLSLADPWDKAQIVVQSLKTRERKTLVEGGTDGRYVPTGHIVYELGGVLFAVPFDVARLAVTGAPVPVVEGVRRAIGADIGSAHFAFSHSGSLVWVPGPVYGGQDLFLFDRKGGAEALKLPAAAYAYPRVSPDGKRVAFETNDGKETNIAIYDLSGASSVRKLTFGAHNRFPIWSADGQRVAFQSDRERDSAVFWLPVAGGAAERLTKPDPDTSHVPESWSPTGDAFLFSVTKGSEISLWTFSMRERKAAPFDGVRSTRYPTDAVFSPDGRWVAYQRSESGQGEGITYIQPFPPSGTIHQIARGGRPQWSRDGTELFYTPAPGLFMAVTVTMLPSFSFTNPRAVPRGFLLSDPANPRPYDITPDGRILAVGIAGQGHGGMPATPTIHVAVNWFEELKRLVPTK